MDTYQFSEADIQNLRNEDDKEERRASLKASRDKIIQGIANNGNRSGERAIWELIQNARDFCGDKPAVISIELYNDKLTFSHQGIPFTIRTLKDLIRQRSSKHEGEDTVGQYGTGFMATHEFSRKVFISGDCKIGKTDIFVPIPEGFCLDRSIEDENAFIDEMDAEIDIVNGLFYKINQGHSVPCPNTVFTYPFEQEGKAEKISAQVSTTMKLMPFVLVFNDRIEKCTLVNHLTGESLTFYKNARSETVMDYDKSVKRINNAITILNQSGEVRAIDIKSLESVNGEDRVIIPPLPVGYDDINSIPSQFLFFPLLGTEDFGTGFIFHSKRLYPTEKRNSFLLPWDNDNMKAKYQYNETVIDELIKMLFDYYDHTPGAQCLPVDFARLSISRTPEEEPDSIRRAYLSKLQSMFADKYIHWKMIPTDRGYLSIHDDTEFAVLDHDIYCSLSEDAIEKYVPALVSYASKRFTLPSEDVVDWSRVVYGWKPTESDYYVTLESVCGSIATKDEDLKSFLSLLKALGKTGTDLLAKYNLIPNRDGTLRKSGDLKDAADITPELYAIAKPILSQKAQEFVDTDYSEFVTSKYDRTSLRDDLTLRINELRGLTLKRVEYNRPSPISLGDEQGTKISDLVTFCSAFPIEDPKSYRARILPIICRIYGLAYAPTVIPPKSNPEADFYSSTFNYLLDNTLFVLSNKPSSWLKDQENGPLMLSTLREFLEVYTESTDDERLKKLNDYGVFPNRNLDFCLPAELKTIESDPALDTILALYQNLAAITNPTIKDYKDVLVHEDFSSFYDFKACNASDITNQMESQLREKDADYSCESTRKVVLEIIEKIDKNLLPDVNTFRDIRQKKPTIFFKNAVSGDKGKHVYTLMKQDDAVIEDLAALTQEPDFTEMISCAKALLQQRKDEESDFQFKKAIGNHIEYLLRQRLGEAVNNSDFKFPDVQNGQDIVVLYKDKPIFFVEVKTKWNFTTSGPAYMSKNQVIKACGEKGRYALCCVDLTNYGLPDRTYPESLDNIMERIKMKFEIGDDLSSLMKPSFDASSTDPENNISIDGDFKARIPAGAFRKGDSFDDLVSKIIEQSQKMENN